MIWLYRVIFLPTLLLGLPYWLWRMYRRGGYSQSFHHRLGLLPRLPKSRGKIRIWLQAVSVGEVRALQSLLHCLEESGSYEVVLTSTTSTGYALARSIYGKRLLQVAAFPIDFWLCSRLAWGRIKPDVVILMESELWPENTYQAWQRQIPVYLVNARMSDRSFLRYQRAPKILRWLMRRISYIFTGSALDRDRLLALGIERSKVTVAGNLKFDVEVVPRLTQAERIALRHSMGFHAAETIILLGASTWPGEEELLLAVLEQARTLGAPLKLLLVPRHAERRQEIAKLLDASPWRWALRSAATNMSNNELDIYVGDTTGELQLLAQSADIAFVGKSLPPNQGGQTPIEAAALGLPILYGPRMSNFRQICESLERCHAATRADSSEAAIRDLVHLAINRESRQRLGAAAQAWHTANGGATQRVWQGIKERYSGTIST